MNDYLKAYIDSFGPYREQESEFTYAIPVKELESLKAERDEARQGAGEWADKYQDQKANYLQAIAERDAASKHRDEMKMLAEVNYNRAEALAVERDEARAELEYSNKSRQYLAARLNEVKAQRDEAVAAVAGLIVERSNAEDELDETREARDEWARMSQVHRDNFIAAKKERDEAIAQRDEAAEDADFWEGQYDGVLAELAKAYAELSIRTLDSLVLMFGDLD